MVSTPACGAVNGGPIPLTYPEEKYMSEKCNINCKFMSFESDKDNELFILWKTVICKAALKNYPDFSYTYEARRAATVYCEVRDFLQSYMLISDEDLFGKLSQLPCKCPAQKEIN
jgi:hypothetical protein